LLACFGVPFRVAPADIDERLPENIPIASAIEALAAAKAQAAAARFPNAIVVAADTIVLFENRVIGKPRDEGQARHYLQTLRAKRHDVITGVCVIAAGRVSTSSVLTQVEMRAYSNREIERSIASGTPIDKAGAYAIQDEEFAPVHRFDGCYCNVVGFPLWTVRTLLMQAGIGGLAEPDVSRPVCATCPLRQPKLDRIDIRIPSNALVVLVGPAGSGKSTFAARHFQPSQVLSTDRLRQMVAGDEADQSASGPAFIVLRMLIRYRLQRRLLTVVDSTALRWSDRRQLLRSGEQHGAPVVAVVLAASLNTCLARNAARARLVGTDVIARQHGLLEQTLLRIKREGFDDVYVVPEAASASVELVPAEESGSDSSRPESRKVSDC
jgi:nucleoside triphosphate pyrophosphatase